MRAFFLLLVLGNLVYFAYAHVVHESAGAASQIARLQIAPEKIRLLKAAGRAPAEKAKSPGKAILPLPPLSAMAIPTACLEWGVFAGPAVTRAEAALANLELPPAQVGRAVTDAGGYWVYMPPQKSRADADRKVGELKALGITEFFLVQEAGQWRNAISLGIFRSEDAANVFLGGLRKRGVRSALAGRRENFLKQVAFYVREPGEATVIRLTALQQEFPGSELKAGPCPPAQPKG